ncbi:MAG: rhomboid family intramembrane serine protease [Bacteroidales bacterium]|jgi:membrane associated rhomboid family serine protease|nr:rhomboid family intramembrane serine protease [Bacteroidales bacterium]MBR3064778.1 rhomboid family intramembrane serine protease [Bacteroidales bacterium]
MRYLPPAVKNLLIINIIVFFGTELIGDPMYQLFALFPIGSPFFRWWQFVTHMFMHGNFMHIFFNMWSLFVFGPLLERLWGSKKFLIFYFVCGLGAALCHELVLLSQPLSNIPTVGASGAIYGLLLGFGMLYPNYVLTLVFPPVSLKAKWFVIIFAAIELLTGILGTHDGVAHFAHLGGMLFGLILILIWKKKGQMYTEWE